MVVYTLERRMIGWRFSLEENARVEVFTIKRRMVGWRFTPWRGEC